MRWRVAWVTTWSVYEKSSTPGSGCALAQLKTVRTASTPLCAMSAHWASWSAAGASVAARSHMTEKNPRGTFRLAAWAEGAAASRTSTAASKMNGRCIRGI